jgi:hypothetical protein
MGAPAQTASAVYALQGTVMLGVEASQEDGVVLSYSVNTIPPKNIQISGK